MSAEGVMLATDAVVLNVASTAERRRDDGVALALRVAGPPDASSARDRE